MMAFRASAAIPRSILREGNTDLEEYRARIESPRSNDYMLEIVDARYYGTAATPMATASSPTWSPTSCTS